MGTASTSGSVKGAYGFSGNTRMTTTTTTITTTISQYGLGGAQYCSWSIMGVTHDARDNVIDVTYSTKPDRGGVITLNAMSTSTTTTTRVFKPIINNTVRPIWK